MFSVSPCLTALTSLTRLHVVVRASRLSVSKKRQARVILCVLYLLSVIVNLLLWVLVGVFEGCGVLSVCDLKEV